jgi:hypothetical protein
VVVPYVEAMQTQVVVIIHVCERENFKKLKVKYSDDGELRLQTVLKKIFENKTSKKRKFGSRKDISRLDECPEASLTFRKICYQVS